jgi:hypothetical protein
MKHEMIEKNLNSPFEFFSILSSFFFCMIVIVQKKIAISLTNYCYKKKVKIGNDVTVTGRGRGLRRAPKTHRRRRRILEAMMVIVACRHLQNDTNDSGGGGVQNKNETVACPQPKYK